jgi:hypothetical protein
MITNFCPHTLQLTGYLKSINLRIIENTLIFYFFRQVGIVQSV